MLTPDSDFWVDSRDRPKALSYFKSKACSLSELTDSEKPIIQVYAGPRKIDLFFDKSIQNIEGELVKFASGHENATTKEDAVHGLFLNTRCR